MVEFLSRRLRCLLVGGFLLGLNACSTVQTTSSGVVGVDREQLMFFSSSELETEAQKAYADTVKEAGSKKSLNKDPQVTARVKGITTRLVAQVSNFRPDAVNWAWEINVIESKEVNAWCMAGGKMAVYTGLLDQLKLTDDELAAVLGHEIAHALREHSREQASMEVFTDTAVTLGSVLLGLDEASQDVVALVKDLGVSLPFSRKHETEADAIGIELSARAGFNPMAAVSLWKKMGNLSENKVPQFLSTHPAPESRSENLQQLAEKVMPLYEAAKSANVNKANVIRGNGAGKNQPALKQPPVKQPSPK
jgi:predicted Zn-dependent protease